MQWSNQNVARLNVKKTNDATATFSFDGVNSAAEAGTPEQFLAAANRLLNIIQTSAVLDGITRTVKQEANE